MHWILQDNLFAEQRYSEMVGYLDRYGIPYSVVTVIPSTHELAQDLEVSNPVYVCGSAALNIIARKKKWRPGCFINDNFSFGVWSQHYRVLNDSALIVPFREIPRVMGRGQTARWFVRPAHDGKAFSGRVIHANELEEWTRNIRKHLPAGDGPRRFDDAPVVIAPEKPIFAEYRLFVIDKKIVTGSSYRSGSRVIYGDTIDAGISSFAQEQINAWQPDRAFVIDIAQTRDGPRVVEINNINSAGFYAADISKIIQAIEGMGY